MELGQVQLRKSVILQLQNMSMLDASANIMLSGIKGKAAQSIWDFANMILDLREQLDQLTITELVEAILEKNRLR